MFPLRSMFLQTISFFFFFVFWCFYFLENERETGERGAQMMRERKREFQALSVEHYSGLNVGLDLTIESDINGLCHPGAPCLVAS